MIYVSLLDDFIRQEKFTKPVKAEELRDELVLDFDNFKRPAIKEEYHALAKSILNLILLEPGTYPDTPEMGINIAKYQFEFLTTDTLNDIQTAITEQVNRYIPSNNIQKVLVMQNTNKATGKKELIIGFAVGKIGDSGLDLVTENFWIRVANNELTGVKTQILG